MATLEQFLLKGALGPIHPGMTQTGAIARLGKPPDESVQQKPKILKYGSLQLTFSASSSCSELQLVLTGLYFHSPQEPIPDLVSPTDFSATCETTITEMRKFLNRIGVKEVEFTVVDDEDTRLQLASGAQLYFRDQKLWSILFAVRVPAAGKKQISVSISEGAWHQLSSLARDSKLSISQLCAQWITQCALEKERLRGNS